MRVKDVFTLITGKSLELSSLELVNNEEQGVNFVSRTSNNNGIVARVKLLPGVTPRPAGSLSCATGGSVLSTFVQTEPYYSGFHLFTLIPKYDMSMQEKLYYAHLIGANKHKYSFGRQANKTLADIELPDELPSWLKNFDLKPYQMATQTKNIENTPRLDISNWNEFLMDDLFLFSKGKRLTKEDMFIGDVNYIGAISDNNGIRQFIDAAPTHTGNCITVNYNGSVGEAFYQKDDFWASDDVNVLTLKDATLNSEIGLFLCTVIKANKFRFGFGRKWTLEKMKQTILRLPAESNGNPDWIFMENYIKQLPYADRI